MGLYNSPQWAATSSKKGQGHLGVNPTVLEQSQQCAGSSEPLTVVDHSIEPFVVPCIPSPDLPMGHILIDKSCLGMERDRPWISNIADSGGKTSQCLLRPPDPSSPTQNPLVTHLLSPLILFLMNLPLRCRNACCQYLSSMEANLAGLSGDSSIEEPMDPSSAIVVFEARNLAFGSIKFLLRPLFF